MVKRKDDGTKNGLDDKAQAETTEGKPAGSDHPARRSEDKTIQTKAGDVESGTAPVAAGPVEGGRNFLGGVTRIRKTAATGLGVFVGSSATSASADIIFGSDADETIEGSAGNDLIQGQGGDDSLVGNAGNDVIFGGDGADTLLGGPGNDTLRGGNGDDLIEGGGGENLLDGGRGDDTFVVSTPGDTVDGGDGDDTLNISSDLGPFEINRDPDDSTSGTINFDSGGNVTFRSVENIVPCFTPGTRIATPRGECAVEALRVGDRVITRDNGLQEIRWIGQRTLSGAGDAQGPASSAGHDPCRGARAWSAAS